MKDETTGFLDINDPIQRSRKVLTYFSELIFLIEKKMQYIHQMHEDLKEKSKQSILE